MLYNIYGSKVRVVGTDFHILNLPSTSANSNVLSENDIDIKVDFYKNSLVNFQDLKDNQTDVNKEYGFYYKKDSCMYEFISGNRIKVNYFNELDKTIIYNLLNYPFAALFYQSGCLCIHASAVSYENKIFLFPGVSLAGKSTIAAFLLNSGAKIICEDTCIIRFNSKDSFEILPSYPLLKISDEAKKYLHIFQKDDFLYNQVKHDRKVYKINKGFCDDEDLKVDFVIYPEWTQDNESFHELSFRDSLKSLLESSFFSYNDFNQKDFFQQNASFVKNTKSFIFRRKKGFSSLDYLLMKLQRIINE